MRVVRGGRLRSAASRPLVGAQAQRLLDTADAMRDGSARLTRAPSAHGCRLSVRLALHAHAGLVRARRCQMARDQALGAPAGRGDGRRGGVLQWKRCGMPARGRKARSDGSAHASPAMAPGSPAAGFRHFIRHSGAIPGALSPGGRGAVPRKRPDCRAVSDGETRTRTGDTTIFRQLYVKLEHIRNRLQTTEFRNAAGDAMCPVISARL